MGGLVVDVSDIYDHVQRVTLTPEGVVEYAKKSSWEHFHVEDEIIRDKSKADNLAKLLVFVQVTWTLLQCISRRAVGYPLTILEVHTLVHALCAMLMYAFWFRKPLNIKDPTMVDTGASPERIALELMRQHGSACKPFTRWEGSPRLGSEGSLPCVLLHFDHTFCEACLLIFDTHRQQLDSEQLSNNDPTIMSILEHIPPRQNMSNKSDNCVSIQQAVPTAAAIPQARILVTGQTLSSGVGPAAWSTAKPSRTRSTVATLFLILEAKLLRLHRPDHVGPDVVEVEPDLKILLIQGAKTVRGDADSVRNFPDWRIRNRICHKMAISLSRKDMLRWQRAGVAYAQEISEMDLTEGINLDPASICRLRSLHGLVDGKRTDPMNTFVLRSPNLSSEAASDIFDIEDGGMFWSASLSLGLVSGAYAAVHLALWNYGFPTGVEGLLWKISCCTLVAPFGILICLFFGFLPCYAVWKYIEELFHDPQQPENPSQSPKTDPRGTSSGALQGLRFTVDLLVSLALFCLAYLGLFLFGVVICAALILYLFSRLYIVVESLLSLRRVEAGVYDTVPWVQAFPHF
ncbi:uncharacterized protein PV07_07197 [Cladophialophora immunda]|uniref:Uncharacterized protein n=1 Tax=Cladophialophora immunda TaxID=569365 RepID=A0A0D2C8R3_9EURO|nr:uncharacterized protein PV07_07197 [Cladophialophora immunda]KIW27463.1 hypothetical protein PV07_07197 [Cladophialophora immunda]